MTELPAPDKDRHLRVGTTQREHALEILRDAAADQRISFDELELRVPRAAGAVTRQDLADVIGDLVASDDLDKVLGEPASMGDGPGFRWEQPLQLGPPAGWETVRKLGVWQAPPFIEVLVGAGGAKLNFTEALARSRLIDLVLVGGSWGSVTLVVPPGWGVDTGAIQADGSATVSSSVPTRPEGDAPRIVLRGRSNAAVKVRTPSGYDEWQARRHGGQAPAALEQG